MSDSHAPVMTAAELAQFFLAPAHVVAPRLLGWELVCRGEGGEVAGVIVETEAYDQSDPASHSYRGRANANLAMFLGPGHVYVYRSYGIHWCVNLVCQAEGHGAAVLLRALEPTVGQPVMARRRGAAVRGPLDLARGPGRLAQAMGITRQHNGSLLGAGALDLRGPVVSPEHVCVSPRIGISRAKEQLWRFFLPDSPYVSGSRKGELVAVERVP